MDTQAKLYRDLAMLAKFISIYCADRHEPCMRQPCRLSTHDVEAIHGKPLMLCPQCQKLLAHAFVKRSHCPMDPKPSCKHCPNHCYHPTYRAQIRQVMKHSGRKLVLHGRFDLLLHLLF